MLAEISFSWKNQVYKKPLYNSQFFLSMYRLQKYIQRKIIKLEKAFHFAFIFSYSTDAKDVSTFLQRTFSKMVPLLLIIFSLEPELVTPSKDIFIMTQKDVFSNNGQHLSLEYTTKVPKMGLCTNVCVKKLGKTRRNLQKFDTDDQSCECFSSLVESLRNFSDAPSMTRHRIMYHRKWLPTGITVSRVLNSNSLFVCFSQFAPSKASW